MFCIVASWVIIRPCVANRVSDLHHHYRGSLAIRAGNNINIKETRRSNILEEVCLELAVGSVGGLNHHLIAQQVEYE